MTDLIYSYKGFRGCESKCRIRIFRTAGKDIVIATELKDNPGTSITNFAEYLATRIIFEYDINPEQLVWIEHYPERTYGGDEIEKETYDFVTFKWDGEKYAKPEWKHGSREEAEALTGTQLEEVSDLKVH